MFGLYEFFAPDAHLQLILIGSLPFTLIYWFFFVQLDEKVKAVHFPTVFQECFESYQQAWVKFSDMQSD